MTHFGIVTNCLYCSCGNSLQSCRFTLLNTSIIRRRRSKIPHTSIRVKKCRNLFPLYFPFFSLLLYFQSYIKSTLFHFIITLIECQITIHCCNKFLIKQQSFIPLLCVYVYVRTGICFNTNQYICSWPIQCG